MEEAVTFISSLPQQTMLWNVFHPFQSIIEAGNDLASARKAMIEKIQRDPGAFITKIVPSEPTAKSILDLGKSVFRIR